MVAPFDWHLGGLPRNPVPTDAIPDIGENQQIVLTDWMGRSPQDVEDQIRSQKTLLVVLPLALFLIFIILYFQFRSVITTSLVFSGIAIAWAGGFIMLWLYGQPWFLDFEVFGTNMQTLFQIHPINLSVAVWVGFLALFGIATDDGVVVTTYLDQSFFRRRITRYEEARKATLAAACGVCVPA